LFRAILPFYNVDCKSSSEIGKIDKNFYINCWSLKILLFSNYERILAARFPLYDVGATFLQIFHEISQYPLATDPDANQWQETSRNSRTEQLVRKASCQRVSSSR
jgi:hypothetical protein